jgi:hypothetical protein
MAIMTQPQIKSRRQHIRLWFEFYKLALDDPALQDNLAKVRNFYVVGQRAVLSSRDPAIYNLRYIVVNGRDNCFLYPVERIGKGIIRFDLIENVGDDEKIFEGTVAIRTGDQIQLGRLINLSMAYGNREFISYQQCGRPSTLTILTDEGKADLQIFISGD